MQQFYPIKFEPILKEKIWGGSKLKTILNKESSKNKLGESWEISGVEGSVSVVSNGTFAGSSLDVLIKKYKGELVGDSIYDKFGCQFPLLIKFIDANQDLSIQVHPDDKLAKERHNSFGKTEMWYVVDAEKDSRLISGFKQPLDKENYLKALNDDNILSLLKSHQVVEGDFIFIPTGNIHATGAGILIAEIQQTSDITYRIYDYNRMDVNGNTRELHTDMALDAINYLDVNEKINYSPVLNEVSKVVNCEYFTTNILELCKSKNRDLSSIESFVVYMCVDGECNIKCEDGKEEALVKGDAVLIPACIQNVRILSDGVKLLETYVEC